MPNKD